MQRSGILSGPGLIVVGVHGLLAALYVALVECGLAPRALALICGAAQQAAAAARCGVCAKPNSRAARRVCCALFALPGAALAALAAAWALLLQVTPEGVWGGALWVAAPALRAAYPDMRRRDPLLRHDEFHGPAGRHELRVPGLRLPSGRGAARDGLRPHRASSTQRRRTSLRAATRAACSTAPACRR